MLQFTGSQRVGHGWGTELFDSVFFFFLSYCFLALKVSIEILSSATSNLLMRPSKAFLISVHVFIYGTSLWFFLSISMYLFALPVCFFMLSTLSISILSVLIISSVQLLSHVRLCDPMNRSTPGLPVHHQLPESTQTHVHRVSDAIQPCHPLSSLSPPTPNPSQHQGLFQWVNSSHEVTKVLEFQL